MSTRQTSLILISMLLLPLIVFSQQWEGSDNTGGNIWRAGNVGIGPGITSPAYPLDVDGDINLTGSIFNNGSRCLSFNSSNKFI